MICLCFFVLFACWKFTSLKAFGFQKTPAVWKVKCGGQPRGSGHRCHTL